MTVLVEAGLVPVRLISSSCGVARGETFTQKLVLGSSLNPLWRITPTGLKGFMIPMCLRFVDEVWTPVRELLNPLVVISVEDGWISRNVPIGYRI